MPAFNIAKSGVPNSGLENNYTRLRQAVIQHAQPGRKAG